MNDYVYIMLVISSLSPAVDKRFAQQRKLNRVGKYLFKISKIMLEQRLDGRCSNVILLTLNRHLPLGNKKYSTKFFQVNHSIQELDLYLFLLVKSILITSQFNPICSLSYLHGLVTNENSQFKHNSLHLVIS